jgi:hypothetical protein
MVGPGAVRRAWHLGAVVLLGAAAVVTMREWFTGDRLPLGDFPGYAAAVAEVQDALLRYGRVPRWCSECLGGTTRFGSNLKEYLAFPFAVWLGPVLATKLLSLLMKVLAALGMYVVVTRLFAAPGAGLVAAFAYGFGAVANHASDHLDVAVSAALLPPIFLVSVELLRRRRWPWAVALGVLLAAQLATNLVHTLLVPLLLGLLILFHPWREAHGVDDPRTFARHPGALLGLALLVFLVFGASLLAWLATDLQNHALISEGSTMTQRSLYIERSPFLYVNRAGWMASWLATHQPPGLDLNQADGERRYLGIVALAIVLAGWFVVRRDHSLRRWAQMLALMLLLQYWLALGPRTLLWQLVQTFHREDLEASLGTLFTVAAGVSLVIAIVLAVRRRRIGGAGRFLGLALLLVFPAFSLAEMLRTRVPILGPLLGLQRSPGHFFDLAPFALYLLLALSLVAFARVLRRPGVVQLAGAAVGLLVVLDFWPSTVVFRHGVPMSVVRDAQAMLAALPGEEGTLRTALTPRYQPLWSFLLAASETGRARTWLWWQGGPLWSSFVQAAAWRLRSAHEAALSGRPHGGNVLLALGRIKYFLIEDLDALPPPWERRAASGPYSVWEQPTVVPMASAYRRYVVFVGEPEEAALAFIPEAFGRNVLVVSAGSRLADADDALLARAQLVRPESASALDDGASRALASRFAASVLAPGEAPAGRWRTMLLEPTPEPVLEVTYRRPAPDRVVLAADAGPAPAVVLLSEAFHPWWRATVDGVSARVLRAQTTLMAIPVGPGRHEIELSLRRPLLVSVADGVSMLACIALLPATIVYGVRRWRRPGV